MAERKAASRRRGLLVRKASPFFKTVVLGLAVAAVLAGYLRFRIEKLSLAYETSENLRREARLADEVAAAEARYNEIFSAGNLGVLAARKGFREPRRSDFIYEPETGGGERK